MNGPIASPGSMNVDWEERWNVDRLRQYRFDRRPARKPHGGSAEYVGRHDVQGHGRALDLAEGQVLLEEPPQPAGVDREVAPTGEPEQAAPGDGEDVVAPQTAPDRLEFR